MSTKGRKYESIDERNQCLWEAYKLVLHRAPAPLKTSDIYRMAVNMPCPQFWISSEQAAKIISAIERRRINIDSLSVTRKDMIEMIMYRVGEMRKESPGMPLRQCIEEVVYSPAPRFFLTPKSAKTILHRYRSPFRNRPRR